MQSEGVLIVLSNSLVLALHVASRRRKIVGALGHGLGRRSEDIVAINGTSEASRRLDRVTTHGLGKTRDAKAVTDVRRSVPALRRAFDRQHVDADT